MENRVFDVWGYGRTLFCSLFLLFCLSLSLSPPLPHTPLQFLVWYHWIFRLLLYVILCSKMWCFWGCLLLIKDLALELPKNMRITTILLRILLRNFLFLACLSLSLFPKHILSLKWEILQAVFPRSYINKWNNKKGVFDQTISDLVYI